MIKITEKEIIQMFRLQDLYKIKYITIRKLTSATGDWINLHIQVLERLISGEVERRNKKKFRKNIKFLNKSNEYCYRKYLAK